MTPLGITRADIEGYLEREMDGYRETDDALRVLISTFPGHTSPAQVLLKASAISAMYHTRTPNINGIARGLMTIDVDRRLDAADETLVAAITGINRRDDFSFATKYCAWHRPASYAIYDSVVSGLLWSLNVDHGFTDWKRPEDARSYPRWHRIVSDFRAAAGATALSYKTVDKYLWLRGKNLAQDLARADRS